MPSQSIHPQETAQASSQRRWKWVAILSMLAIFTGCNLNFTITDGYVFNYEGDTAEQQDGGDIPENIKTVKIVNRFGEVQIGTVNEEELPAWNWECKVWANGQEVADTMINDMAVEVEDEGSVRTLTFLMPEKKKDLNGVKSIFTLNLKPDTEVDFENSHGDAEVNGIQSKVVADVSFGDVQLDNVRESQINLQHGSGLIKNGGGNVQVTSKHSKVVATDITGDVTFAGSHSSASIAKVNGNVDLKTSFDDIIASDITGTAKLKNEHGDIEANVKGDITLENKFGSSRLVSQGSKVTAKSEHGDLRVTVANVDFENIKLTTTFDDIDLYLPEGCQPVLDMKTKFGKASSPIKPGLKGDQFVKLKNSHGDIRVHVAK